MVVGASYSVSFIVFGGLVMNILIIVLGIVFAIELVLCNDKPSRK